MAKRSAHFKLAKDLVAGDRAQVVQASKILLATVVAAVPSVQVVRRNVILVTYRTPEGRDLHRQYYEGTTVQLVPEVS